MGRPFASTWEVSWDCWYKIDVWAGEKVVALGVTPFKALLMFRAQGSLTSDLEHLLLLAAYIHELSGLEIDHGRDVDITNAIKKYASSLVTYKGKASLLATDALRWDNPWTAEGAARVLMGRSP